jgi:hypothetical protein
MTHSRNEWLTQGLSCNPLGADRSHTRLRLYGDGHHDRSVSDFRFSISDFRFSIFSNSDTPCSRIIAEAWHELSGPKADHLPRQAREERFYAKNKEQIEQQLLCFLLCLFGCLQGVRLSRFHARCCSRRRTARPARLARCESYQPRPALSARFRVVFVSRACLGNS